MKTFRNPCQQRLIDPFDGVIGKTGWRQIEEGWQGLMRHVILQRLPALRLGAKLSDDQGRPSAELYAMCGLLLIREFNNWTVPQTHEAALFRSDVQYALNLEPGFEVSQRTIERYIAQLHSDDSLAAEILVTVTDHLVRELELSVKKQRLDSTHVLSDMAVFGRTRMMGIAVKRFLVQVHHRHEGDYEEISEALRSRYEQKSDPQLFGDAKTTEARQLARQQAAEDLHTVIEHFADHDPISCWATYQQLLTIFGQQCEVIEDQIEIKKQTGGAVIQNPSDSDATYCGRKGPGYQVQLSETCDEENEVNLIVAAKVESAVESDARAVEPVLDDLASRNQLPESLLADCGYGGDDNVQHAKSREVELVSPVPGGAKFDEEKVGFEQFTIDEGHTVTACPAGHTPLGSEYNAESDRITVTMDADVCSECPLLSRCSVKLNQGKRKTSAKVHFKMFEHRAGERRLVEQTAEFRDAYRNRSGIEGTNSCLKRRLGLKRVRVRGRPAVTASVLLKVAGWNILRASASGKLRALISAAIKWGSLGILRAWLFLIMSGKTSQNRLRQILALT